MATVTPSLNKVRVQRPGDNRANANTSVMRASAATTTSYVVSTNVALVPHAKKVALLFTLTWVDSTSHEYYVEWSYDGTNFFREVSPTLSGGVDTVVVNNRSHTIGASTKWMDSFDVVAPYMRVYLKKTGGVGADAVGYDVGIIS